MEKVATSFRPQTGSSNDSDPSTDQHQKNLYASERARFLFGQYRKGDANDPETYVASVAIVLADYSMETIHFVTDPRTGISRHPKFRAFQPNSGEVQAACEEHARRSGYTRQWEINAAKQLAERQQLTDMDDQPRITRAQINEKFAHLDPYRPNHQRAQRIDPELTRKNLNISKEQWDAIPNLPTNLGVDAA